MGENHLTYFKIENFKRFDSFEMENLGQYNLLVGDNNVGKTSVLEGLCFDEDSTIFLIHILRTLIYRKILIADEDREYVKFYDINLWKLIFKDISKPFLVKFIERRNSNIENIELKIVTIGEISEDDWEIMSRKRLYKPVLNQATYSTKGLKFTMQDSSIDFFAFSRNHSAEMTVDIEHFPLIPTNSGYEHDLIQFYYKTVNSDKNLRKEFEKNLKTFIPKLEEIRTQKIFDNVDFLGVVLKDGIETYPITRFGDGTVKLTRILLEILMAKGKRLMIDEIETGIHFSRLKDFWKTVITLCKKYDVQLFATTHSLECQKYFVYALAELEEEDRKNARNISLLENKEGNVESVTFDYEQFEFALEIGANTRGGER